MDARTDNPVLEEIVKRHDFFERWFNGLVADDDLGDCLSHFHPEFRRIDPTGQETNVADLAASLRARRDTHRDQPMAIGVEDVRILWRDAGAVLATYVEVQRSDGRTTSRRSTALFVPAGGTTDAPLWRHVQETRI